MLRVVQLSDAAFPDAKLAQMGSTKRREMESTIDRTADLLFSSLGSDMYPEDNRVIGRRLRAFLAFRSPTTRWAMPIRKAPWSLLPGKCCAKGTQRY